MPLWKSMQYRMSLIWRGEIEVVTIERILLSVLRAAFIIGSLAIFSSTLGRPLMTAWQHVTQALAKAGI